MSCEARRLYAGELEGDNLDSAVFVALGFEVKQQANALIALMPDGTPALVVSDVHRSVDSLSFCRDWRTGGRLIQRYQISVKWTGTVWTSTFRDESAEGESPLESSMRALVTYALIHQRRLEDVSKMSKEQAFDLIFSETPSEALAS